MNTAVDCRALAAENEAQAAMATLSHVRERFEASAVAWHKRADMLESIGRLTMARSPSHRNET